MPLIDPHPLTADRVRALFMRLEEEGADRRVLDLVEDAVRAAARADERTARLQRLATQSGDADPGGLY